MSDDAPHDDPTATDGSGSGSRRDDDYTPDEKRAILDSAAEVLLAAVAAEKSGPLAYFREMTAAGTFLYDARKRFADNRLVQELFAHRPDAEVRMEEVTEEALLEEVGRVGRILRNDEEGRGFRRFLVELARRVVRAHGGLFGGRIGERERAFLQELEHRLGYEEPPS